MPHLFTNNAASVLNGGISAIATSMQLRTGDGSLLPALAGGDTFLVTLIGLDSEGQESTWEIVRCTARSGDVLTVVRGQEGTTALSWLSGTRLELRMTAAQANDFAIAHSWGDHGAVGYEPGFAKNSAFNRNFGATAGTVAQGNDARINNGQTAYSWGNHGSVGYVKASEHYAVDAPTVAATTTLDLSSGGSFSLALNQNTTLAFSNLAGSIGKSGLIALTQDATGGRTITLPAVAKTPLGGAAIAQHTVANSVSALSFFVLDSTTVLVNYIGNYA